MVDSLALVLDLFVLSRFPCGTCTEGPACSEGAVKAGLGGGAKGTLGSLLSWNPGNSGCREAAMGGFRGGDADRSRLVSLSWDFGDSDCCGFNMNRFLLGGNIGEPGFAGSFPSLPDFPAPLCGFSLPPLRCSNL